MKQLRLSLAATVLTLAFSIPAFAGDIYGGITQTPPPPPASTGGRLSGYVQPPQTSDAKDLHLVAEVTLNVMRNLLFLF